MRRRAHVGAGIALAVGLALAAKHPPSERDAPFVETFHRGEKTLLYIAAVHHSSVRYPDAMRDPVFETINQVFSTAAPQAVIVEGVDPAVNLAQYVEHTKECAAAHYNLPGNQCDEPALAAYLASQNGAMVYTGEPSAATLLADFEKHGYTIQDFLAYWIMNNVAQEKRHGELTEDSFRAMVERVVRWENHLLGTSTQFTMEDFAAWYAKHMQTPRNYMDLVQNDGSPDPPPNEPQTLFHTLSALSTQARDDNVLATIKTAFETHNRVLVVYGASHLRYEWNALVALMGTPTPKKSKLF